MTTSDLHDDLELALAMADAADATSFARFGAADLRVDSKPDMTPVTDADRDVERGIRQMVANARPSDAVIGEEFGGGDSPERRAAQGRCWVVDPIDGTKNFVRGVPIWATLIALLIEGRPALGVVSAPALARRWWGAQELGAHTSFTGRTGIDGPQSAADRACRVSNVTTIDDASLSIAQLNSWDEAGRGNEMRSMSRRCWRTRGYGDFYSYMLVAQGAVDIAAEPELSLWDLAALAPIVVAAGGSFTDINGVAISPRSTSALATNGQLHSSALTALRVAE